MLWVTTTFFADLQVFIMAVTLPLSLEGDWLAGGRYGTSSQNPSPCVSLNVIGLYKLCKGGTSRRCGFVGVGMALLEKVFHKGWL